MGENIKHRERWGKKARSMHKAIRTNIPDPWNTHRKALPLHARLLHPARTPELLHVLAVVARPALPLETRLTFPAPYSSPPRARRRHVSGRDGGHRARD